VSVTIGVTAFQSSFGPAKVSPSDAHKHLPRIVVVETTVTVPVEVPVEVPVTKYITKYKTSKVPVPELEKLRIENKRLRYELALLQESSGQELANAQCLIETLNVRIEELELLVDSLIGDPLQDFSE